MDQNLISYRPKSFTKLSKRKAKSPRAHFGDQKLSSQTVLKNHYDVQMIDGRHRLYYQVPWITIHLVEQKNKFKPEMIHTYSNTELPVNASIIKNSFTREWGYVNTVCIIFYCRREIFVRTSIFQIRLRSRSFRMLQNGACPETRSYTRLIIQGRPWTVDVRDICCQQLLSGCQIKFL